MRYKILLYLVTISVWLSPIAHASTEKIEMIEQENSGLYETIKRNQTAINAAKDDIEKATEALEEAKQALARYEEAFDAAQEKFDEDSSPENATILEMNKDRRALALRKVASREKRLNKYKQKVEKLTQSSNTLEAQIADNNAEVRRLKDELETKKLQAAQAVTSVKQASPKNIKAPTLPAPSIAPKQELAAAATTPDEKVAPEPSLAPASTKVDDVATSPAITAPAKPAIKTAAVEKSYIETPTTLAIAEIKKYLTGEVSQSPELRRSVGKLYLGDKIKFSHLGGEIYSAEVELEGGENTITFDDSRFRLDIPEEDHEKLHVLYIDNRSDARRLLFVEKSVAEKI